MGHEERDCVTAPVVDSAAEDCSLLCSPHIIFCMYINPSYALSQPTRVPLVPLINLQSGCLICIPSRPRRSTCFQAWHSPSLQTPSHPEYFPNITSALHEKIRLTRASQRKRRQRTRLLLRNHMAVHTEGDHALNFQERVQQLERQLKEMEREKERELNALRKEKREAIHTSQTVRETMIAWTVAASGSFDVSLFVEAPLLGSFQSGHHMQREEQPESENSCASDGNCSCNSSSVFIWLNTD